MNPHLHRTRRDGRRFIFAGASSLKQNDFVACLLQSRNLEARRLDGRKLSLFLLGSYTFERKEELHYPDESQFSLSTTICRNPHYTIKNAKSTQTDFPRAFSSCSMCDAATQVSTIQTFTLRIDLFVLFPHWIYSGALVSQLPVL